MSEKIFKVGDFSEIFSGTSEVNRLLKQNSDKLPLAYCIFKSEGLKFYGLIFKGKNKLIAIRNGYIRSVTDVMSFIQSAELHKQVTGQGDILIGILSEEKK